MTDNTQNEEWLIPRTKQPSKSLRGFCSWHGGIAPDGKHCNDGRAFPSQEDELKAHILKNAKTKDDVIEMLQEGGKVITSEGRIYNFDGTPMLDSVGHFLTVDELLRKAQNFGKPMDPVESRKRMYESMANENKKTEAMLVAKGLGLRGYSISSLCLAHSIQDDPSALTFKNDTLVVPAILKSSDYQNYIKGILSKANEKGLSEFTFNSTKDNVLFNANEKILEFNNDPDLKYSIHGLSGGIKIYGIKDAMGRWHLSVTMKDEYDFHNKEYDGIVNAVNNRLFGFQNDGIINPYWITINFGDFH